MTCRVILQSLILSQHRVLLCFFHPQHSELQELLQNKDTEHTVFCGPLSLLLHTVSKVNAKDCWLLVSQVFRANSPHHLYFLSIWLHQLSPQTCLLPQVQPDEGSSPYTVAANPMDLQSGTSATQQTTRLCRQVSLSHLCYDIIVIIVITQEM